MADKRLSIINVESTNSSSQKSIPGTPLTRCKEQEAYFERSWLMDPKQFDPLRNAMQHERLNRTWKLINEIIVDLKGKSVIDIGCGSGEFTRQLRDAGAKVDAIDISENALKLFKETDAEHINLKRETMPFTSLPDQTYDVVVCLDVLAELSPKDYRLFFAELARLLKPGGYVICSTPIDIFSDGGVEKLLNLAESEFVILAITPSYHGLYIRFKHFLEAPHQFVKGWLNPDLRRQELRLRTGFSHAWYWINTTFIFMWIWLALQLITNPLAALLRQSQFLLLKFEKICHFIWGEQGISHLIFIAQERPLNIEEPHEIPIRRLGKKEIWE